MAWINGGFDTARKEDLPVVGAPDLRYGGIGGLSEFLGWTDAQRQNSKTEGFIGGFQNVLKLVSFHRSESGQFAIRLATFESLCSQDVSHPATCQRLQQGW